jgi:hypothetical protein
MKGFDNGFKNAFVNSVCENAYLHVLEDIKELDYDDTVSKCTYCKLPYNGQFCCICDKGWCGRDYYCKRPFDDQGVLEKCLNGCNECLPKCHVCNDFLCFFAMCCDRLTKGLRCRDCSVLLCIKHTISINGFNYCELHIPKKKIKI